jgi:hypothetical protein
MADTPTTSRRFPAATLCLAALAALAACTGGTSTGSSPGGSHSAPSVVQIFPAATDPMNADPLTNADWQSAPWHTLTGALDDPRSGPPTRAAMLYDAENLYVAFISEDAAAQDSVELWLDSSTDHLGKELFCVSVQPDAPADACWYRAQTAAQPLADGSPDRTRALTRFPKQITGMQTKSAHASVDGKPVWTVVVKLPLALLPGPLSTQGTQGRHMLINLLRYDVEPQASGAPVVVQSNLAPIYRFTQPLSPYRMAEVVLSPARGLAQSDTP